MCDGRHCVTNFWVCDGDTDCSDGTDEDPKYCQNQTCNPTQFTCLKSSRCIPAAWRCDYSIDCGPEDDSDEQSCSM